MKKELFFRELNNIGIGRNQFHKAVVDSDMVRGLTHNIDECIDSATVIRTSFSWAETEEGADFWHDAFNRLDRPKTPVKCSESVFPDFDQEVHITGLDAVSCGIKEDDLIDSSQHVLVKGGSPSQPFPIIVGHMHSSDGYAMKAAMVAQMGMVPPKYHPIGGSVAEHDIDIDIVSDERKKELVAALRRHTCDCGKEKHGFMDHVRGCPADD